MGQLVYHLWNRGVDELFAAAADDATFEKVLAEAQARQPARLLGYCLMPGSGRGVGIGCDEIAPRRRPLPVCHPDAAD